MSDLSLIKDFSLTIPEARKKIEEFNTVYSFIEDALMKYNSFRNINGFFIPIFPRPNEQYTVYHGQEKSVERSMHKDRVFPLETVTLKKYNSTNDTDLDEALIHIGPFADEYARSFNALALTVGKDIFFRNNAFDTGKEDGRKTLTHELTHVAQYKEGKLNNNNSLEDIETEAACSEKKEGYKDDSSFLVVLKNKTYKIKRSDMDMIAMQITERLEKKIYEQRYYMDEEDYLKLLLEYKSLLEDIARNGIFGVFLDDITYKI